jgi:ATP-dependent RNA helicase DDX3X
MSGRTARIGNEGLATSFYNERDEPIADFLVKILLETGQDLPEFWADRKPEDGEALTFDDDSGTEEEGEEEENSDDGGDAWGAGGDSGDAWAVGGDTTVTTAAEAGWGVETGTVQG